MKAFLDLKNGEDIYLYNNYIGRLHEEKIINLLSAAEWFSMTEKLREALVYVEYDTHACANCGGAEFREKIVVDGVRIGYCVQCSDQIVINNNGDWASLWDPRKRKGYARARDLRKRSA